MLLVAERAKDDLACVVRGGPSQAGIAVVGRRRPPTPADGTAAGDPGKGRSSLGTGPAPGPLAMLFPGQGSQYVGMLRELACRFPRMQAALALANDVSRRTGDSPVGSDLSSDSL